MRNDSPKSLETDITTTTQNTVVAKQQTYTAQIAEIASNKHKKHHLVRWSSKLDELDVSVLLKIIRTIQELG